MDPPQWTYSDGSTSGKEPGHWGHLDFLLCYTGNPERMSPRKLGNNHGAHERQDLGAGGIVWKRRCFPCLWLPWVLFPAPPIFPCTQPGVILSAMPGVSSSTDNVAPKCTPSSFLHICFWELCQQALVMPRFGNPSDSPLADAAKEYFNSFLVTGLGPECSFPLGFFTQCE